MSIFAADLHIIPMTTTISLPTADYDIAKAYAKEQNLSIDKLLITLIRMLPQYEEDLKWSYQEEALQPYTMDELNARIDEAEAQFDRGDCITHEQLMDSLKEEFAWLK